MDKNAEIGMNNITRKGEDYISRLSNAFNADIYDKIELLSSSLEKAWVEGRNIYICGNGGSAANAMHIANDLIYGVGSCGNSKVQKGMKVEALSSNSAVLTCLANDTGYENIFSKQLKTKAVGKDILIALSGSGNSKNILKAIKTAQEIDMKEFSIVAFKGGTCKSISHNCLHFEVNDMQIAEDTQLIVGHMIMQYLSERRDAIYLGEVT